MAELDRLDPDDREEEIKQLAGDYFTSLGKLGETVAHMESDMKDAARAMQFEKAAEMRDRLKRLKMLQLGL